MKEGKKKKFKGTVFMRLILDTTFLLWRPPKICTLHGGKIEHYLIFQNLTSTCHGPTARKPCKVNADPQLFNFLLVQNNIYSHSPLCTRLLTPVLAEIWFFKSLDRVCRTKGPLPNLGRLTVYHRHMWSLSKWSSLVRKIRKIWTLSKNPNQLAKIQKGL